MSISKLGATKKNRIWELDFFRGLAILLVLVDHTMYDFSYVYTNWANSGVAILEFLNKYGSLYMNSEIRFFWRPAFLFIFFCTSGLSTAFSRDNFFRGVKLACVAMFVSVITYFIQKFSGEEFFILFGVLHCLAVIIIFYSLISKLITVIFGLIFKAMKKEYNEKIVRYFASAIYLILAGVFLYIHTKYNVSLKEVNSSFATVETESKILGMFFFVRNWWTADYFPLFPFIAFFFFGAALTQIIYPNKKSLLPSLDGKWNKFFTVPGKFSLIIYLSGQIVSLFICSMLSLIFLGSIK